MSGPRECRRCGRPHTPGHEDAHNPVMVVLERWARVWGIPLAELQDMTLQQVKEMMR